MKENNSVSCIVRNISGNEQLMIEALDGKAYISDAKKVFSSFISKDFTNWKLNKPGPATAKILCDVDEVVRDGNSTQIFTGINSDLDKIVMTQAQIIRFCEKHPTWLRQEGYTTFFLTEMDGEYFVVRVRIDDGLIVLVTHLKNIRNWLGIYKLRVVYPRMPLAA